MPERFFTNEKTAIAKTILSVMQDGMNESVIQEYFLAAPYSMEQVSEVLNKLADAGLVKMRKCF